MNKAIKTVGVLMFNERKVLLVQSLKNSKHLLNTYGLPAGKVETNESLIEAALRELKEETGLITSEKDLQLLQKTFYAEIQQKDSKKLFSFNIFLCHKFRGQLIGSSECKPVWIDIKDISNYNLLPNIKEIVDLGLNAVNL